MKYRDALIQAIEHWNSDPIEDEWFFERFRDEVVGSMTDVEAFEAIDETIDFLLCESDESTACEIVQTIINLAKQSQTTEFPNKLSENLTELREQFSSRGDYARSKFQELLRHYRMS